MSNVIEFPVIPSKAADRAIFDQRYVCPSCGHCVEMRPVEAK